LIGRLRDLYGAGPRHVLLMLGSLALAAYAVVELGVDGLWDPDSWWQSVAVWFVGAAVVHDLVVFPVYAVVDRVAVRTTSRPAGPALVNHVRVPLLAAGLTFVVFWPGIVQQGSDAHLRATGLDQEPYLEQWLVLTAAWTVASALLYGVRVLLHRRARG
jgi:hypothetical protein